MTDDPCQCTGRIDHSNACPVWRAHVASGGITPPTVAPPTTGEGDREALLRAVIAAVAGREPWQPLEDAVTDAVLAAGYHPPGEGDLRARGSNDVAVISAAISGSYPTGLDPEAHLWRRCMKVAEETGEVTEALLGLVGENPRKGTTHNRGDVERELLDVALAALGAVSHLHADTANTFTLLADHAAAVSARLRTALDSNERTNQGEADG